MYVTIVKINYHDMEVSHIHCLLQHGSVLSSILKSSNSQSFFCNTISPPLHISQEKQKKKKNISSSLVLLRGKVGY